MTGLRVADWAFFLYFGIQIPSTIFFDTQGVYPEWLYPSWAKSLRSYYLAHYRDPFLADAWQYPWYLAVCLVEHFMEVPFFFWATYVYYQYGAEKYPRIILPSLMYGIHTITAILGVFAAALGSDFSQSEATFVPRTFGERVHLCSAYTIFFVMSIWIVIDCSLLLSAKLKRD